MPYIKNRERFRDIETAIDQLPAMGVGDLNYLITLLLLRYHRAGGRYQQINDIMGVLAAAGAEFYRRVAVPYEDTKIRENGDVY